MAKNIPYRPKGNLPYPQRDAGGGDVQVTPGDETAETNEESDPNASQEDRIEGGDPSPGSFVVPQPVIIDTTQTATSALAPNAISPVVTIPDVPAPEEPVVVKLSPTGLSIKQCLENYYDLIKEPRLVPASMARAASLLKRATEILVASPTDEVLDIFWDFHRTHKMTVMDEKRALQGVNTLDNRSAELVMTIYTAFRHYVLKDCLRPGDNAILKVTKNQRIVAYLKSKSIKSG